MAPVLPAVSGTLPTSESPSSPSVAVPSAAVPESRPARYRVSRTSRRTFDSWGAYDRTVRRASTAVP